MPTFGGFSPFPLRLGGGSHKRIKAIYDSLGQALGTAYDISDTSTVVPEIHAEARLLAGIWSGNQRVSNQFDPTRMTDMLPRWEAILGVPARTGDTFQTRRARVGAKMAALGDPDAQNVQDAATALLGTLLLGIEYTTTALGNAHWPETGEPTKWTSNVAHILFRVGNPSTDADFWQKLADARSFFNDFLPAWTTYDFGILNSFGVGGFRFDEPNFGLETFT